jgi:hypothetical protein
MLIRNWCGFCGFALATAMMIALTGCATTFKEHHYYQSVNPKGDVTNYYRLTVKGYAAMSSARYISGYYDERAVDLFFDELKVKQTSETETQRSLFRADLKDPGTPDVIKPLSPSQEHGTFVMILSTNASSVSQTIGQFAENQVVADAITNLANRDALLRASGSSVVRSAQANATADELARLIGQLPDSATPTSRESEISLLRVANSLASGLASRPVSFNTLDDATAWFAQSVSREDRQ